MRKNMKSLTTWLSIFITGLVFATIITKPLQAREWADWCQPSSDLGWHFYCDPNEKPDESAKADLHPSAAQIPSPLTATEQIDGLRAELVEARSQAILAPTQDNVLVYLSLQRKMVEQASDFAEIWKQAVWQHPELDYENTHPQGHIAKQIIKAEQKHLRNKHFASLSEDYGIIYIGSASCAICHAYGPLLRDFAGRWNLHILAVSSDNSSLQGFPHSVVDNGQLSRLGLKNTSLPMTVLFDRANKSVVPIGAGFITYDELERRIYSLTAKEPIDAF